MIGFYRALLRLYPAGFRAEYGGELVAAFAAEAREHTGVFAPVTLVGKALADVIPNALGAHLDILRQDVRYTVRGLRRSPGFALTAILVVALGVGANTAAFSLADFVLLRPLPYPEPERLVKIWQATPGYGQMEFSPANYRDVKAMTTSYSGMGAFTRTAVNLVGDAEPRRLETAMVTPELLPLVGVGAFIGRVITPADSAGEPTVVISHGLWESQFGRSTAVIGRTVRLNGTPHIVIGVMPPDFHFPNRGIDLWTPIVFGAEDYEDRNDNYIEAVARLAPGKSVDGAAAELDRVTAQLEAQFPKENKDTRAAIWRLQDELSERSRLLLLALCGAALCILLLACANLASLLLARGLHRGRELAVRTALGAGRERLIRQLITESAGLAAIGGLVGIGIAAAGLPLLAQLVPATLPIGDHPTIDLRVLAFAAALIAITGLAFGIAPALRAGRGGTLDSLRDGTRTGGGRRQRVRSALVMLEVTGSIVLLVSSGLLMRAIWKIQSIEPGFRTDGVMVLRTALPLPKYETVATRERFYGRVLDEVRAMPGVASAAYATGLPMDMRGGIWPVQLAGGEVLRDAANTASLRYVTPGFFSTLGIRLLRGRDVSHGDTQDRPYVAVVSESFAERHWPGQDPIGKQFGFAFAERTIVGIVSDVKVRGLERTSEPQVYLASPQVADGSITGYLPKELVIRSTLPPERWVPAVRRIIAAADPEQPISNVRSLTDIVAGDTGARRVQLRLLTMLSAIALVIAGVGIHGLLSFAVSTRTQELGIRRALGAQAGSIVGMVLREGLILALAGTAIGIAAALAVGRGMSALLFGVPAGDPLTLAAAAGLCLLTAIIGCLRPAMRAARVDPMSALREG
jgi:putative ABC transport system permease protein